MSDESDLIADLHALSAKSPKLVSSTSYASPTDPAVDIRSWKMNEFKYYEIPSPFPTLARGLFSTTVKDTKQTKKYRIVIRGYDKFFNIGEVPWTTWDWLEEYTTPPYILSVKSNGCIIFIAALTPSKLLITSKHSLGPVQGVPLSHAQAGEIWLRKYLEKLGKTEEDLAAELWENNWTAIAELCDDSFEEHVLGYLPEKTGLHLHGLNIRSKKFQTMPTDVVDTFAEKWGFITTPTTVVQSIKEVKDYTDACAVRGEWNDEPIEGFVVRTNVKGNNRSPYKSGSSFFFKVKFDEPYMMYRDWREVTKMLLSSKYGMNPKNLPKSKMKRAETKLYVDWVTKEFKKNPDSFKDYTKGKGIIATREKFLAWMKSEDGEHDLASVEKEEEIVSTGEFGKTIIVPIAVPGCGKTAVSVALAHLFGFGHTQSDDVQAKKSAHVFIKNVVKLLNSHDVVIADKNNHLKQHRQQLRDSTNRMHPPVRLLALNWALEKSPAIIHRICGDRVVNRGDNHQTLRADTSGAKSHEEVIWMFLNTKEDLAPAEVDAVIEMNIEENLEQAVDRAVKGVVKILGLEPPSEEKITEAVTAIQGYSPAVRKQEEKRKKIEAPRYYALLPEVDLFDYLDPLLTGEEADENVKVGWELLKLGNRVTSRPHITIVHKNSMEKERELWDRCAALHSSTVTPPTFKVTLGKVVWNGRVMAVAVEDFNLEDPGKGESQEGAQFVSKLPHDVRDRLHITVGTAKSGIQAVEAMEIVKACNRGSSNGVYVQDLDRTVIQGRVKGLIG